MSSYNKGYGMTSMSPYKAGPSGYDNASSFGGGGFFTSPSGSGQMRMSQDAGGRPNNNERTLTAVTIKQILTATPSSMNDSKFLVDGQDLNQVKVVGVIVNVNVQSTNIAYTIDDSTGLIDVKIWQTEAEDDTEQQRQRQSLVPGVYARVFGKVQEFNNVKTISGFCIRPLTDFNEIASHLALCALTHLRLTKSEAGHQTGTYAGGSLGNIAQANPNMIGFSNLQNAIMNVFRGNIISENGLSVSEVKQRIGGHHTHEEIKAELSFMAQEGHLYSTCDEDHFSPTGML